MKEIEKFHIDIFKLSNSIHEYDFEFNNSFFNEFEEAMVQEGEGKVHVVLDKSESFIKLTINIEGKVKLTCDRSLDEFYFNIDSSRSILFKYGEEEKEIDDKIVIITRDKQRLNLAQYIYEFIGIEIPMKKLHPRFQDDDENDEMVYSDQGEDNTRDSGVDPRWDALKKLK